MVVAEVLTGIALVQQSVKFIKDNISTAKDIGDIASQIDNLFTGEKQVQQARNKKSKSNLGDQFGVNTVAKEMIDAKLAAEKLQEVATMVDMRFGHGTWASILAERAKRIQEAKEAKAAELKKRKQEQEDLFDMLKLAASVIGAIIVAVGAFVMLMVTTAKGIMR
jgi:hypothetical protein